MILWGCGFWSLNTLKTSEIPTPNHTHIHTHIHTHNTLRHRETKGAFTHTSTHTAGYLAWPGPKTVKSHPFLWGHAQSRLRPVAAWQIIHRRPLLPDSQDRSASEQSGVHATLGVTAPPHSQG